MFFLFKTEVVFEESFITWLHSGRGDAERLREPDGVVLLQRA